jgi:hypothetical protein
MLWWKAWFDVRWRLASAVALIAVVVHGQVRSILDMNARGVRFLMQRFGESDMVGFWASQDNWVFLTAAVLLAVGGVLAETRSGQARVTFNLPVARWRWLAAELGIGATTLTVCAVVYILAMCVALHSIGLVVPTRSALRWGSLLLLLTLAWYGLALIALAATRTAATAALLTLGSALAFVAVRNASWFEPYRAALDTWSPMSVMGTHAWEAGIPPAFFAALALAIGGPIFALRRVRRIDV